MATLHFTGFFLLAPALLAQYDRFGAPACAGPGRELADQGYFVVCHDGALKVPVWAGYELRPEQLIRAASRPGGFRSDPVLRGPRAVNGDYRGSGFSRGHMAPAADFGWSDEAVRSTFVLSNAAPQYQRVNAGRWGELEALVRRIAAHSDAVVIYSGPLFGEDVRVIGAGRVAVPSHFFKVVLAVEGDRKTMYAAIVPNQERVNEPLGGLAVTVREVERRTQLDFFAELEDSEEHGLETRMQPLRVGKGTGPGRHHTR